MGSLHHPKRNFTDYVEQYFGVVYNKLHEMFGFDRRSMALFRITVALVVLGDLIQRAADLKAHYTDAGIIPRSVVLERYGSPYYFPVHMINGTIYYQAAIFLIHGLLAVGMLIGYYTHTCVAAVWFLTLSLQEHNPLIGHAGDVYFRCLLFYGIFLPLGSCYSVDSAYFDDGAQAAHAKRHLNSQERKWWQTPSPSLTPHYRYLSFATVAVLMQMTLMYTISWYHKTGDEWRVHFTATWWALQLDYFSTFIGRFLANFRETLKFMTWAVAYWEKFGSLFYIIPWKTDYFRMFAAFGFMMLHVGFGSCLRLGTFAWITILAQTICFPTWFWEVVFYRLRTRERLNLRVQFNTASAFSEYLALTLKTFFLLPETRVTSFNENSSAREDKQPWGTDAEAALDSKEPRHRYDPQQPSAPLNETLVSIDGDSVDAMSVPMSDARAPSGGNVASAGDWLVSIDSYGNKATNLRALGVIMYYSPLLWWVPYITARLPSQRVLSGAASSLGRFLHIVTWHQSTSATMHHTKPPLHVRRRMAPRPRRLPSVWSVGSNMLLLCVVLVITSWNLSNIGSRYHLPYSTNWFPILLRIDQSWNMFSPHPPKSHWWYVIEANLDDGTVMEIFKNEGLWRWEGNQPFNFDKPEPFYKTFGNHRWYKFFENGYNSRDSDPLRLNFGRYVCREWNDRHSGSERLYTFTVHFVIQNQNEDGTRSPYNHSPLWSHICYDKPK